MTAIQFLGFCVFAAFMVFCTTLGHRRRRGGFWID